MILGKKDDIEPGYVFAPYIISTGNPVIISDFHSNNIKRKVKINKIFELGLNIIDASFHRGIKIRHRNKCRII